MSLVHFSIEMFILLMKDWCFWTVVLEKTPENILDYKEIQPIHPKGDQAWVFIGRADAEVETPILWPPNVKNWLICKDPDAGKDWRREDKGTTEDEMIRWHHQLSEHEFDQIPGVGDGQGGLVCCSPWGHKESDTTEWLKWTEPTNNSLIPWSTENKLKLELMSSSLKCTEWLNMGCKII